MARLSKAERCLEEAWVYLKWRLFNVLDDFLAFARTEFRRKGLSIKQPHVEPYAIKNNTGYTWVAPLWHGRIEFGQVIVGLGVLERPAEVYVGIEVLLPKEGREGGELIDFKMSSTRKCIADKAALESLMMELKRWDYKAAADYLLRRLDRWIGPKGWAPRLKGPDLGASRSDPIEELAPKLWKKHKDALFQVMAAISTQLEEAGLRVSKPKKTNVPERWGREIGYLSYILLPNQPMSVATLTVQLRISLVEAQEYEHPMYSAWLSGAGFAEEWFVWRTEVVHTAMIHHPAIAEDWDPLGEEAFEEKLLEWTSPQKSEEAAKLIIRGLRKRFGPKEWQP